MAITATCNAYETSIVNKGISKLQAVCRGQKARKMLIETRNEFIEIITSLEGEGCQHHLRWSRPACVISRPLFLSENVVEEKMVNEKENPYQESLIAEQDKPLMSSEIVSSNSEAEISTPQDQFTDPGTETDISSLQSRLTMERACDSVKSMDREVSFHSGITSGEEKEGHQHFEANGNGRNSKSASVSASDEEPSTIPCELYHHRDNTSQNCDMDASQIKNNLGIYRNSTPSMTVSSKNCKENIETISEPPINHNVKAETNDYISESIPLNDETREGCLLEYSIADSRHHSEYAIIETSTPVSSRSSSKASNNLPSEHVDRQTERTGSKTRKNNLLTESWMTDKSFHLSDAHLSGSVSHADASFDPENMEREELEKLQASIGMELLWIEQAIQSRKEYLRIKIDLG